MAGSGYDTHSFAERPKHLGFGLCLYPPTYPINGPPCGTQYDIPIRNETYRGRLPSLWYHSHLTDTPYLLTAKYIYHSPLNNSNPFFIAPYIPTYTMRSWPGHGRRACMIDTSYFMYILQEHVWEIFGNLRVPQWRGEGWTQRQISRGMLILWYMILLKARVLVSQRHLFSPYFSLIYQLTSSHFRGMRTE